MVQQLARRLDSLRVSHERYEHNLREQQISKLAAEAELKALRAQLNPHFLFNALTTIGYLIQDDARPRIGNADAADRTLRAVLKRSRGEFTSLGEELDLVDSYLAIEKARFEERLRVLIDVPLGAALIAHTSTPVTTTRRKCRSNMASLVKEREAM